MNEPPIWLQYVGPAIGTLGFLLAILSLILQRWDKRPRLKIRHKTAMMVVRGLPDPERPRVQIFVANPGEQTINVASIHLLFRDGRRMPFVGDWALDQEGNLGLV